MTEIKKESATYQKKRFLDPEVLNEAVIEVNKDDIRLPDDMVARSAKFYKVKLNPDWKTSNKFKMTGGWDDIKHVLHEVIRGEIHLGQNVKVLLSESRIAKGFESLDAEDKVKHIMSHPYTKYAGALKDESITDAIIRKAVKDIIAQKSEPITEDTVEVNGKWVNKGEEGTHGEFDTKAEADAQRKAMFARGFKEEGEAPATITTNVANPELPIKLKESK